MMMKLQFETFSQDSAGLTLKNLRTFFWLARYNNYHLVARHLGVTQPAISSRIALLEDELGVRLFSRNSQSVELTPEGSEALRLCEKILDDTDLMIKRFSRSSEPSGYLKIGIVETVARTWLPTLLNRMQERYPNIKLEITTESTTVLHELLENAALSMCVSVSSCDHTDISSEKICQYPMEWVANPDIYDPTHRYSRRELTKLPMIDYLKGSPPAVWLNKYFGDDIKDRVINNTTNSMSTMIWLAENKLGVAAIPPSAIPQYLADGRLGIIKTNVPLDPMPFYLNYRMRPHTPVSQTVRSLVLDVARKEIEQI